MYELRRSAVTASCVAVATWEKLSPFKVGTLASASSVRLWAEKKEP